MSSSDTSAVTARTLAEDTPRRLPDIWRAQEFPHWFLHMLNVYGDSAESGFLQGLATARLRSLEHYLEAAAHFATGYVRAEEVTGTNERGSQARA